MCMCATVILSEVEVAYLNQLALNQLVLKIEVRFSYVMLKYSKKVKICSFLLKKSICDCLFKLDEILSL